MTKAEIISSISNKIGIEKIDVQAVIEAFMSEVKNSISNEEDVFLRGFGSFSVKSRSPRIARNPRTGEKVQIGSRLLPYFKAGKELNNLINS